MYGNRGGVIGFGLTVILLFLQTVANDASIKNMRDRQRDNLIWRQTRSLTGSGDPELVVLSRPKFNDPLLRAKRNVDHPVQNMVNGVDLSDPEFLPDHHHGRRRVKKVLESDQYVERQYNDYYKKPGGVSIPRMKRFVLPFNLTPFLAMKFLFPSGKEMSDTNSGNKQEGKNSSEEKEIRENGILKNKVERSFRDHNLSGFELKSFHDAILSIIPTFCPQFNFHSDMLQKLQTTVSAKIGRSQLPMGDPWIKSNLVPLIKKIKDCAPVESKMESKTNIKTDLAGQKPNAKTDWGNIVAFETVAFQLLKKRCKNMDDNDRAEIRKIASTLFSVMEAHAVGFKNPKPNPAFEDEEMADLVYDIQDCFIGNYSNYLEALENNS